MIFVTVGTHEQQFNRLIKKIEFIKKENRISEEIVIQYGYSTEKIGNCVGKDFFDYEEMKQYMQEARVVITHGGPSSFMPVLSAGKIPIVVPRLLKFNEHVNDHQLDFAKKIKKNGYNIIVVEDIEDLENIIQNYSYSRSKNITLNNKQFNLQLTKIIQNI